MLHSAFDLKERGALTDADYHALKGQLLERLESMETEVHAPQPLEGGLDLPPLEMYAADFHRMMVQQMYQEYPHEQSAQREYMQRMISMLVQQQALRPSDMPHMRMMVDTVCDNRFGENIERLMEGAAKLQSIDNQVRLSAETSRLAKAVSGIAHNSAQNAVFGVEQGTCSGLQWKDARLAILPPFWPTIIDSGACVRPTFIAPEPTLLILGSQ
jgi:hypothetical protein